MFRHSCRSSSPFPLTDLDMWDTKSRFTAKTSAWTGMATVSGSGFLSKVSTSTSGFRQNDPGLKKWQSLSHLVPEGDTRSFPPSPGAELQAARGESSFKQADVVQWLQDAHEYMDTRLDRLRTRDAQLSYNITTAQLLDMKHKQLSEAMNTLEQEKGAAELSSMDKNQQRRVLHEKVLKLEKDLLQMMSAVGRGGNDQPTERTLGSLDRTLEVSQENFNRQERQKVDKELCKLREALKEAETRAKTQEEERNQALHQLQTSTETHKMLSSQIEEMNQRLSHTLSNYSEVQDQLSEANNKISQSYLEKAILSTQVLKLEDSVKELNAKLTGALSDKDHLIKEKAYLQQRAQVMDFHLERKEQGSKGCEIHSHLANVESHNKQDQEAVLMKEETKALTEVNERLTCDLETIKQSLDISQSQLQELTAERAINTKQIKDLEAECAELIRLKEELLNKINEGELQLKEKCCLLRDTVEVLESEKQKLQDQCWCLESNVLENEEKLQLLEEEHRKQDAVRVQNIGELKAVASHWTQKWQKVALTLQATQEELKELKKNNSRQELESDSLLRVELEACKQELELERSRSQVLLHKYNRVGEAVQTQDKETMTDLSESSLLWEPPSVSHSSQNKNKSPQLIKKASEDNHGEDKADVSTIDSLRAQLEESRRSVNQLQQEKMLAVQKLQMLNQLYLDKNENQYVEGRKDKNVCPVNIETVQQRRKVTEELKSLFKEREEKEVGKIDNTSAAAPTGTSSPQDWTPTCKNERSAVDRWSWQQSSGLMPVFEEDEEGSDLPEGEEGKPTGESGELHAEDNLHNQMSAVSAEISNLKARNENLLQAIRIKRPTQDLHSATEKPSDTAHCSDECDLQRRTPSPYPDGVFLAELVNICSPDEDEEEGKDK